MTTLLRLSSSPLISRLSTLISSCRNGAKRGIHPSRKPYRINDNNDGCWSVIAYNLSDELRIDKAQKLLENFKEYELASLPKDLSEEGVMLSLKSASRQGQLSHEPLHNVVLFSEGSIVFWGVPYDQQRRVLYGLNSLKVEPHPKELIKEEKEHMTYTFAKQEKSRLNKDIIQLAIARDLDELLLDQFAVSHAIALSVKLGIWEALLDQYIDSIGWVTTNMKNGTRMRLNREQVFRKTGELYELKHCINLSSDLLDLPDVYWDRPEQEDLFSTLTSYLNIRRRTTVINEKLNNCCELINLLASHINDRHHIRLEWMIIVLIMVEVLFEVARFLH